MQDKHDRDLCPTNSRSSVRWPPGPIPETTPEAMGAGASATLTGRRVELVRGKTAGPPPGQGANSPGLRPGGRLPWIFGSCSGFQCCSLPNGGMFTELGAT